MIKTQPAVTDLMFRDTITARMLRTLCDRGKCTQVDFMDLYHLRCDRVNPGRSSFGNNFGRFVRSQLTHRGWHTVDGPIRCIQQTRGKFVQGPGYSRDNTLSWFHPEVFMPSDAFRVMSLVQLSAAEQFLEREATTRAYNSTTKHFYSVDDEAEVFRWLLSARAAMKVRS